MKDSHLPRSWMNQRIVILCFHWFLSLFVLMRVCLNIQSSKQVCWRHVGLASPSHSLREGAPGGLAQASYRARYMSFRSHKCCDKWHWKWDLLVFIPFLLKIKWDRVTLSTAAEVLPQAAPLFSHQKNVAAEKLYCQYTERKYNNFELKQIIGVLTRKSYFRISTLQFHF